MREWMKEWILGEWSIYSKDEWIYLPAPNPLEWLKNWTQGWVNKWMNIFYLPCLPAIKNDWIGERKDEWIKGWMNR